MKTFVTVLGLLVLTVVGPVFAAETAPPPIFVEQPVSSPACAPATSAASGAQNAEPELPAWLTGKPLYWSEELASELPLAAGCAVYCRECGGCCVIGTSWCACC